MRITIRGARTARAVWERAVRRAIQDVHDAAFECGEWGTSDEATKQAARIMKGVDDPSQSLHARSAKADAALLALLGIAEEEKDNG